MSRPLPSSGHSWLSQCRREVGAEPLGSRSRAERNCCVLVAQVRFTDVGVTDTASSGPSAQIVKGAFVRDSDNDQIIAGVIPVSGFFREVVLKFKSRVDCLSGLEAGGQIRTDSDVEPVGSFRHLGHADEHTTGGSIVNHAGT